MKSKKWFDKLDDRIMVLYQMDQAIQIGRLQGENYGMRMQTYYRGEGPMPEPLGVTAEHKLQRHLEREFKREKKKCR